MVGGRGKADLPRRSVALMEERNQLDAALVAAATTVFERRLACATAAPPRPPLSPTPPRSIGDADAAASLFRASASKSGSASASSSASIALASTATTTTLAAADPASSTTFAERSDGFRRELGVYQAQRHCAMAELKAPPDRRSPEASRLVKTLPPKLADPDWVDSGNARLCKNQTSARKSPN